MKTVLQLKNGKNKLTEMACKTLKTYCRCCDGGMLVAGYDSF